MEIVQNILDKLKEFIHTGWMHDGIAALRGVYQLLPEIILVALAVVVLLFGKKLLGIEKFLGFLVVGFLGGYLWLAEPIAKLLKIDVNMTLQLVVGGIVGLVAALLFKYLYWLCVLGVFGGGAFYGAYLLLPKIEALSGDDKKTLVYIIAGVIGLVIAIIAFALLKWIEMLGTSALAGAAIALLLPRLWTEFTTTLNWGTVDLKVLTVNVSQLVLAGVLFLIGSFVQIKTRRLY